MRCHNHTQKCPKKCPTWLQNRPKLGSCWPPKPSSTRPRAKKNDTENKIEKQLPQHKSARWFLAKIGPRPGRFPPPLHAPPLAHFVRGRRLLQRPASAGKPPERFPSSAGPPKLGQKSVKNRSQNGLRSEVGSGADFGTILGRFLVDF